MIAIENERIRALALKRDVVLAMIRSTLTAHLAERDRKELTLQLNDRDIGFLATHRQQHYVASGNRRVQLIAGILTDKDDPASIHNTRVQLRQWQLAFRNLQIYGLTRFLEDEMDTHLDADFLFLMTADIALVFCHSDLAVYLHRAGRIYRQQPTYPLQINLGRSLSKLDFYAFKPQDYDSFLMIDPKFIDLFNAEELEDLFSDMRQLNVSMAELSNIASKSGYAQDTSWFSVHVQRIDRGSLSPYQGQTNVFNDTDDYSSFLQSLQRSKVVPLVDGNVRIPAPGIGKNAKTYYAEHYQDRAPKFISSSFSSAESGKKRDKPAGNYPSASRMQDENPPTPGFWDRVKLWNTNAITEFFKKLFYRLTHLFENSRSLSVLTFIAIVLIVLLLVVWMAKTIFTSNETGGHNGDDPLMSQVELTDIDPDATNFEIEVEVRANSLQIMSTAGGSDLVATLQRGDTVIQIAEPDSGWVRVRLEDGRQGYALEELLFPGE